MPKLKTLFLSTLSLIIFVPFFAGAEVQDWGWFLTFTVGFQIFIESLIIVVVTLSLLFFLWGLAVFILNAGNEEKRKEGKKKIFWGIITLTVMVGVWGLVGLLLEAFGIADSVIDIPSFPAKLP